MPGWTDAPTAVDGLGGFLAGLGNVDRVDVLPFHKLGAHKYDALAELDVRDVPHAIRHATVFGALDAVPAGTAMVLIAPHDPLPLLAQIEQRDPGVFSAEYLERGPEAWRLRLSHR